MASNETRNQSAADGSAPALALSTSDVSSLTFLLQKTGLPSVECVDIFEVFETECAREGRADNCVSQSAFVACVRRLVPGSSLSDDDKDKLTYLLMKIFFQFDRGWF